MIVEDEGIVACDLAGQLRELGYEPTDGVATAEEALGLIETLRPHLILMDIHLAGPMDGIAAAQIIHDRFDIPVVFVSANLAEAHLKGAQAAQPFGYLTKPFQSVELRLGIDLALTKHCAEVQMRQSEERLALHAGRIQALLDLHQLAHAPRDEVLDFVLEASLKTTQSEHAFVGTMNADEGTMTLQRCSKGVMAQCAISSLPTEYLIRNAGLWANCVRQRQPVICNNYPAPHPGKKGLPEGHVAIRRFLAIPVLDEGRMVAVVTVANKAQDYVEADIGPLATLVHKMWEILARQQAELKWKEALEQRMEWERQGQRLQKAESLNRMAGAIAHHFNNHLHVVMMNLEMIRKDLSGVVAGEASELLGGALHAARKAAEVSIVMLTYLGQTHCKFDPLDLSEVCQQHLPVMRAILPPGVILATHLPDPGPAILANSSQVQQVLTNLITNAWEAMKEARGTIRLTVTEVVAAKIPAAHRFPTDFTPQDRTYACLEVDDTGGGMSEKNIEQIFDPFFSSKFTGRGMGLAVVLGILRAHGGLVTVESEPGRGSIFRVFLPGTEKLLAG